MRNVHWAIGALLIAVILFTGCSHENLDPEFTVERDTYGMNDRQQFDLYLPQNHDANTPTVVLVHGGAWVIGPEADSEVSIFTGTAIPNGWDFVRPMINEGYAVAILKYRLACYSEDPAEISADPTLYYKQIKEDIDLALKQLRDKSAEYGISSSKFALLGESAGGHIALDYALDPTSMPELKTVVSFYAPTELKDPEFISAIKEVTLPVTSEAVVYRKEPGVGCIPGGTGTIRVMDALSSYVSTPIDAENPDPAVLDPLSPAEPGRTRRNLPTFILHGENDQLVPVSQANLMINELESEFGESCDGIGFNNFSCRFKMQTYSNCDHGWAGSSCNTDKICKDMVKWFDNHLR